MIKFFRKIRYTLMSENKTGRYFKYAIGEIILVVIGILIALQINNWNETQKDRIIEQQILDEMLISLKNDKSTFKMLEKRLMDKDSAIQKILDLREKNGLLPGKSFGGLMGIARQKIRFTYDKSPYENIVALGINKMSNKELLKTINKYYTQNLPRMVKFMETIEDEYLPKFKKSEEEAIKRGVLKKLFVKRSGDEKWSTMYQSDPDKLLDDENFYQAMINEFEYMSNSLGRLRTLIDYNDQIINRLEKKITDNVH
ncbi:DUF6090 family protein [Winogradskyella sp. A3E31]|uniref:DUF6090 family protein n=1 Tax=Winogradskyella sp. A3E31 TaxID=3349637 RepID=UPI00398B4ABA